MFKCTLSNHKDIGVHRNCIFGTQSFQEINVDSGEGHVGQHFQSLVVLRSHLMS